MVQSGVTPNPLIKETFPPPPPRPSVCTRDPARKTCGASGARVFYQFARPQVGRAQAGARGARGACGGCRASGASGVSGASGKWAGMQVGQVGQVEQVGQAALMFPPMRSQCKILLAPCSQSAVLIDVYCTLPRIANKITNKFSEHSAVKSFCKSSERRHVLFEKSVMTRLCLSHFGII